MKKVINVFLIMAMLLAGSMFTGCSDNKNVIGIIQFGNHESLNNCYVGILQGLIEGGVEIDTADLELPSNAVIPTITAGNYTIQLENSNFDSSVSATQASSLVNKGVGLILAIATPSTYAAISSSNGKIPVVYCAVSDPVGAGFTDESVSNVTGSSDILNFDAQLAMIRAFLPDADKIGVMYTQIEANSVSQINTLKEKATDYGFTIVEKSITKADELEAQSDALLNEDIDCITNLTDNTVVGYLENLLTKANAKNIPIFGSEIEQVKKGCLASESLDYVELGRQTGLMAAKIIKGEKTADEINYLTIEDSFPCYNSETLDSFKMTLPEGYADILNVTPEN